MKILKLTAENVKKLSVVEIVPGDKGLVIVAGKNGAGKSSVLDAIMYALAGKDSLPSKPVRKGEDKAKIELDLGDYTVTRTITPTGGGSLVVRNRDNQRLETPQTILDGLFGKLTFDPLEFKNQKADKRSETLRALVGLDFEGIEAKIKKLYDERTEVNRRVKAKEAMLTVNKRYPDVPTEEQSLSEIFDLQRAASDKNAANERERRSFAALLQARDQAEDAVKSQEVACEATRLAIKEAQARLVNQESHLANIKAQRDAKATSVDAARPVVEGLKDEDLAVFRGRISEIETVNLKVRKNKEVDVIVSDLKTARKESDALSDKIDKLEKEKRLAVQNAKFPVEGLTLSDTREVEFKGIPFDEVNTADQLRVSVAMGLAMNPKLRVLLVRQGNDLDADNLRLIGEMAQAAEAQVWLERVSEEGDVAVIIEDGHVKEVPKEQEELIK